MLYRNVRYVLKTKNPNGSSWINSIRLRLSELHTTYNYKIEIVPCEYTLAKQNAIRLLISGWI